MNAPPPTPETVTLLRRLLDQVIAGSEQLAHALSCEREALSGHDPAALERAVAEKLAATRDLQQRLSAHEGFLAARRLPPGREGTERFLALLPPQAQERGLWERIQALGRECRRANEVNGSLVALTRSRTQRALEILRGSPDPAKTYGRLGQTRAGGHSQLIGSV